MQLTLNSGGVKRLRRAIAGFGQCTFQTPLDRLPPFVSAILGGAPPIAAASLTIAQAVFTPDHLVRLLTRYQLPAEYSSESCIHADNAEEVVELLTAALSGSLDFYLAPEPRRFILYADHDEYTTLYAPRKGFLSSISERLNAAGFQGFLGTSGICSWRRM